MSKELVRLPRDVAEIVDYVQKLGDNKYNMSLVVDCIDETQEEKLTDFLNDSRYKGFHSWYSALVNGYEIEETPEDKVRNYYNEIGEWCGDYQGDDIQQIIKKVLSDLDIKIEGVNA